MDHFWKWSTVIHSPEDAATFRQWRRAVCFFYAAISFTLLVVWGVQQLGKQEDEAQIAGSATLAHAVKAVHGERTPQGRDEVVQRAPPAQGIQYGGEPDSAGRVPSSLAQPMASSNRSFPQNNSPDPVVKLGAP